MALPSWTNRVRGPLVAAALALLTACGGPATGGEASDKLEIGLFTTLPILWAETADMGEMLRGDGERSWAGGALQARYSLEPLDTLNPEALAGKSRIVLAQPRPLAPSENVALDDWVRAGGRALIFADPMLTRHSRYHMGDQRRPQDVVLLSPILTRWGLTLTYDEDQPRGERIVQAYDGTFPVDRAGSFAVVDANAPSECIVSETGLLAQCRVGKGRVTLLADAALFDWESEEDVPEARRKALNTLVDASLDF